MTTSNNPKHRGGLVGGVMYLVIVLGFIGYAFVCQTAWCQLTAMLPFFPWINFLIEIGFVSSFLVSFAINLIIFSLAGFGIEKLLRKGKRPPQTPPSS